MAEGRPRGHGRHTFPPFPFHSSWKDTIGCYTPGQPDYERTVSIKPTGQSRPACPLLKPRVRVIFRVRAYPEDVTPKRTKQAQPTLPLTLTLSAPGKNNAGLGIPPYQQRLVNAPNHIQCVTNRQYLILPQQRTAYSMFKYVVLPRRLTANTPHLCRGQQSFHFWREARRCVGHVRLLGRLLVVQLLPVVPRGFLQAAGRTTPQAHGREKINVGGMRAGTKSNGVTQRHVRGKVYDKIKHSDKQLQRWRKEGMRGIHPTASTHAPAGFTAKLGVHF